MTGDDRFDDLVGSELDPADRERLRRVHDLLVTAGPPAELPPEIEAGPTLGMTLGGRPRGRVQRRVGLIAAALTVVVMAFLVGYISGNDQGASGQVVRLAGTALVPAAQGTLRVEDADAAGNWPMQLTALGLPKLPPKGYYAVFLTRNGKIWGPCGSFVVKSSNTAVSVQLNAPYVLHRGDGWVVTRQDPGRHGAGAVVLRPASA
ncbi:MAG: hypothetical protein QOF43_661 [Gaiellaceae bacterium]|nr:hypothetical protein [Gaiellaceae bacterium]